MQTSSTNRIPSAIQLPVPVHDDATETVEDTIPAIEQSVDEGSDIVPVNNSIAEFVVSVCTP